MKLIYIKPLLVYLVIALHMGVIIVLWSCFSDLLKDGQVFQIWV